MEAKIIPSTRTIFFQYLLANCMGRISPVSTILTSKTLHHQNVTKLPHNAIELAKFLHTYESCFFGVFGKVFDFFSKVEKVANVT